MVKCELKCIAREAKNSTKGWTLTSVVTFVLLWVCLTTLVHFIPWTFLVIIFIGCCVAVDLYLMAYQECKRM